MGTRTPWIFALAAVLVGVGCEPGGNAADHPLADGGRVAEEVVNGLAQQYADLVYNGRLRAVTVDVDQLDALASFPVLQEGLRRVAERPSDRDAWVLRFEPSLAGGVLTLHADVIDPYIGGSCCVTVGAVLDRAATGEWLVKDFYHSGHSRETDEHRAKRIARRVSR